MPESYCQQEIGNKEDFIKELKREIARIRRYGHRITLLLIEPSDKLEGPVLEEFKKYFLEELRSSDTAFMVDEMRFSAILPDTHEAGGEAAALRIKRKICSGISKAGFSPPAFSIGVVSLDSSISSDIDAILEELEKDLRRDRKCQSVTLGESDKVSRGSEQVLLSGVAEELANELLHVSGIDFRFATVDPGELESVLVTTQGNRALILGTEIPVHKKQDITKKIRFNREINNTFVLWLEDEKVYSKELPCDLCLPGSSITADIILPIAALGLEFPKLKKCCSYSDRLKGMLDSISATAHQLNQPLQIILGRFELFMLNLDDTPENSEFLNDIKQMRRQALIAADINRKIGRLAKYDKLEDEK